MLFKISLFFISLLSVLQLWHRSTLADILAKPIVRVDDYPPFLDQFKSTVLCLGLLLLVCSFLPAKKHTGEASSASSFHWLASFSLILGICAGLVVIVNPSGRFPWNERPSYITVAARPIKANLYRNLDHTPTVIIFGSSISFTTPASFFEKEWGVDAFNMTLNGGGPVDFVQALKYMIHNSPDGKIPSTIVVEILSPSGRIGNPTDTPLKMISYLPFDQIATAVGANLNYPILGSSVSASIFTMLFVDTNRWQLWMNFADDGTSVLNNTNIKTETEYQRSIKNDITIEKGLLYCDRTELINSAGKEYIEQLIALSRTNQLGIVFYRPPINEDFYTVSKTKPDAYAQCKNAFNTYMQDLTQHNPNMFYRDLSSDPKISVLGRKIYMDNHHLNEKGNILVLQALHYEITSALEWAKANRK